MKKIKSYLKKIFPVPANSFYREIKKLHNNEKNTQQKIEKIQIENQQIKNKLETVLSTQQEELALLKNLIEKNDNINNSNAELKSILNKQSLRLDQLYNMSDWDIKVSSETMWAEIYNDTTEGSDWLTDTSFSPGRWAVGYQYLYVLYRILNEIHPLKILDLGLGQSSRMISQFATANPETEHVIVENNPEWIEFFKRNYTLPNNCIIKLLDLDYISYKNADSVRCYKDFSNTFNGQKYDLISIDAPLGGDMKDFARIDVLNALPEIISDRFIILLDDYNRQGEKNTLEEMKRVLSDNNIEFEFGVYKGAKESAILCCKELGFLTTM